MTRPAVASLGELAERVRPVTLGRDKRVPVLEALQLLLPEGLPRGRAVTVTASAGGATILALALAARAVQDQSWVAVVGLGNLGLVAAHELGVPLERLVMINDPGSDPASVVAALIDGLDIVIVGPTARLSARDVRRLLARLREREAVMLVVGGEPAGGGSSLRLHVSDTAWVGLDNGAGHLRGRRARVETSGRGADSRPRYAQLWLPGPDGAVEAGGPVQQHQDKDRSSSSLTRVG